MKLRYYPKQTKRLRQLPVWVCRRLFLLFVRFIKKTNSSLCLFFYKMNVGVIGETGVAVPENRGYNPLALYHYEKYGFYIYASTETILDRALAELGILRFDHTEIDTNCGDIIKIDSTGTMERGLFDTSNLFAYDYRFLRSYYWDYPDPSEHEPQDIKQLKDFAASIGVAREDIDLLLSYGYFVEEIEEMLYQPGAIEEVLCEILNECAYDYCGEF